ncbi:MAG: HlyC/CorC family transporter [Alphaproteobacteria bacterium]|nr:MAG: HlyC/CorC family transporter [Alphaproteobacteria bacterium]
MKTPSSRQSRWSRLFAPRRTGHSDLKARLAHLLESAQGTARRDRSLGPEALALLANILENGELRVEDVMVPRVDVVAIETELPFEEAVRRMIEAAHSRLPVYRASLDEVVGMIHVKDALRLLYEARSAQQMPEWKDIIRPVLFVAPSMRVLDLLARMRAQRIHMAIVVDEYGGTDGLVTIEDLVEQIVGEIEDEHDTAEPERIRPLGAGRFDIDARLPIEELEEISGLSFPSAEEEDIDTVGGLVFALAGRVPEIGERIRDPSGLRFEVLDADPRRLKRLRITLPRTRRRGAARAGSETAGGSDTAGGG